MLKKLLFIALIPLLSFAWHKQYYSLTTLDYNTKEKSIQITMQLFTDDMELAMNQEFEKNYELGTHRELAQADASIKLYLSERFQIRVNGNNTPFDFVGKEYEKDVMYVYLEIKPIEKIQNLQIQNKVLIDTYPEQKNIIKVNYLKQQKSLVLTQQDNTGSLEF